MDLSLKKDLKVLVVSVHWPPETFVWQLLKGLAEKGVQIQLGVSVSTGERLPSLPNISMIRLPRWEESPLLRLWNLLVLFLKALSHPNSLLHLINVINSGKKSLSFPLVAKKFYRLLPFVGLKPDILHFQWNSSAIEYEELFDFFGRPTLISCHGSQIHIAPHNPKCLSIREDLKRTFQRANLIHCVSENIKNEAILYGLDPKKTHVIRPSVDVEVFHPNGRDYSKGRDKISIVTVGSFHWVKGYEYALIAIKRLMDQGIALSFHVIGDGSERQRILYTIHDLGLEKHVVLHGRLAPEEIRNELRKSDIFLLSSVSEGISNALLEAMACGLPVVTTDCGGIKEAVSDEVEGFLVPVRNSEAMAEKIARLVNNPELRKRMGSSGREKISNHFALNQQVDQFSKLFREMVSTSTNKF